MEGSGQIEMNEPSHGSIGFSGEGWTARLREIMQIQVPATLAQERLRSAHALIKPLRDRRTMNPRVLDLRAEFDDDVLAQLLWEADRMMAEKGRLHNGKWNAPVGPVVERFVDEGGLFRLVQRLSGFQIEDVQGATFIAYKCGGEFLDFHVDGFGFGEANLLLCLRHVVGEGMPSSTAFLVGDELLRVVSEPGVAVLFDGGTTPHARSPVSAGEEVVLVSFGFTGRRRRAAVEAPSSGGPVQGSEPNTSG